TAERRRSVDLCGPTITERSSSRAGVSSGRASKLQAPCGTERRLRWVGQCRGSNAMKYHARDLYRAANRGDSRLPTILGIARGASGARSGPAFLQPEPE